MHYEVAITGISDVGLVSVRLGAPPNGIIQGHSISIGAGSENWSGSFPVLFVNNTGNPVEATIHVKFADMIDGDDVYSDLFSVTVLPLGWSKPNRIRKQGSRPEATAPPP